MSEVARTGPTVGVALILSGIATVSASLIEFASGTRGDGDNPADSLRFLAEHGANYSYSGLALVVGGALLVIAVVGVYRLTGPAPSYAYSVSSVFGLLSGGFLTVAGVMRLQAVGTVPFIQSLDESWGEAAYLAVQMAGTQGALSTGMMTLAAWLISLAVLFARRRLWAPVAFGLFPVIVLAVLVLDLIAPTLGAGDSSEVLFLTYVAAITLGMPLCCAAFGVALTLPRVRLALSSR